MLDAILVQHEVDAVSPISNTFMQEPNEQGDP